jgi:hypothetical protein
MLRWCQLSVYGFLLTSRCRRTVDAAGESLVAVSPLIPKSSRICWINCSCGSLIVPFGKCSTLTPRYSSSVPSSVILNARWVCLPFLVTGALSSTIIASKSPGFGPISMPSSVYISNATSFQ